MKIIGLSYPYFGLTKNLTFLGFQKNAAKGSARTTGPDEQRGGNNRTSQEKK
jgi:hypothetical protein